MASVTEVSELLIGNVATFDIATGIQITRVFYVQTDDPSVTPLDIKKDSRLPKEKDVYPSAVRTYQRPPTCRRIQMERWTDSSTMQWKVTCSYDNQSEPYSSGTGRNPWLLKPTVGFSFVSTEQVFSMAYDVDDTDSPSIPVQNSAHLAFNPPLMTSDRNLQITVQLAVNPRSFSINSWAKKNNTCNSKAITICGTTFAAYTLYMADMRIEQAADTDGVKFWNVTMSIVHEPDTWKIKVKDKGMLAINTDVATKIAQPWKTISIINNETGAKARITEPTPLDNGQPMAQNHAEWVNGGNVLSFAPFRYKDWSTLQLPKVLPI